MSSKRYKNKMRLPWVKVYKFQNGNYEYWVWDGTLDSQQSGTLEVYKNNKILMQRSCTKN